MKSLETMTLMLNFGIRKETNFEKHIASTYDKRFKKFGPKPEASMWFCKLRQNARFALAANHIFKNQSSGLIIADVGCGYGAFLNYLDVKYSSRNFYYNGYDISERVIEYCKKFNSTKVQFYSGSSPAFLSDFVVMSGTYNFAPTRSAENWENYIFSSLLKSWKRTKSALIFNLMVASETHISDGSIFYANLETMKQKCASKFGKVSVLSNHILKNEATFVIERMET